MLHTPSLRLLTLNTWGAHGPISHRQEALSHQMAALSPDIVCLQEVFTRELADAAAGACQLFHRVEEPSPGLTILSRFPVHTSYAIKYTTISPVESHDRRLLLARLALDPADPGRMLWVGNTHLSWKADDEDTRQDQTQELLDETAPLNDAPVIICGDFNAEPGKPSIRNMRRMYVDAFAQLHPGDRGITWDNANPFIQGHATHFPDRRIDYIWIRKIDMGRVNIRECRVALNTTEPSGHFPSDHYGVLAELTLTE